MVMKYVLEAKTGRALGDALAEWILEPAGMRETYACVPAALQSRCVCYNYEHRIMNGAHIPGYLSCPDCEITAIADISPEALKKTGDRLGIPEEHRYLTHRELL